jgi:flagellar basal body rod protein FlgF
MKKFSLTDFVIIAGIVFALLVGLYTAKHFRQTADKQIEATSKITFQVFLRGVTVTGEEFPIKLNDKAFITIRNVPYTELTISAIDYKQRMVFAPAVKSLAAVDPAQPALYDATVTISDTAKITKDGAVVGGNKIKIGLPVTLEGVKYRFNGTISDLTIPNVTDNNCEK